MDSGQHRYEIENLRRSLVMLTPGQDAGLRREEAISLLRELQEVTDRLDTLRRRLRELADEG